MATQTTYYDLIKVEGTDLVNPLTQLNPNMDAIDAAMHGLSVNAIGTAVEVITGTVHALTRVNQTDAKFIQFIASGDYDTGDTFTLDGVAINATYPDGTSLETDAYATGATVLIGLNADDSTATFYLSKTGSGVATDSERLGGELPAYYSSKSYADDIKTTADAAAAAIAKKALVNVYYDSVSGKLYRVLADGSQGGEIKVSRELDFANKVTISTTAITTTKAGAIIATGKSGSTSAAYITVDDIKVGMLPPSDMSDAGNVCINDIPSGKSIKVVTAINANANAMFVPYK